MGTVGSCCVRASWAAVLYGHRGQLFCTGTVGSCFVRASWAAVLYGHRGQLFCTGIVGSCFSDGWMDMTEIRRGCGMYLANGPVVIWYQDILL